MKNSITCTRRPMISTLTSYQSCIRRKSMKKYKAVIYDIDGTILNTLNMNMYPLIRIIKEETGEVIYIGYVRSEL